MRQIKRTLLLLSLAALFWGCPNNDDDVKLSNWSLVQMWPRGTRPVASPVSDAILFSQEESPAGLYLFNNQSAFLTNPGGPQVRTDYTWSRDGQKFCVSGLGQSGESDAGIYWAWRSQPTQYHRAWDRGSHPRFLNDGTGIVCAGPEDGSDAEGIWFIDLADNSRERLAPTGLDPEVSPNEIKIAYLIRGDILGRVLVVLNLENLSRDTLAPEVLNYSWLGDSRQIVFETWENGGLMLKTVPVEGGAAQTGPAGSLPWGFPEGTEYVYSGINGDQSDGLWMAGLNRAPSQLSTVGTYAHVPTMNRIVAQADSGIIELTR